MIFTENDLAPEPTDPPSNTPATGRAARAGDSKRPKLKVVK
jgi:hypothetical protein